MPLPRPSRADLEAARARTIPDVIAPDLRVLFCGINPGLYSGATGHHFARPGNRFWKTLQLAGFTERVLDPAEQALLLDAGLGITNLVARTTATAYELTAEELRDGAQRLEATATTYRPMIVASLGISAYRLAFRRPGAVVGLQPERLGRSRLWILPNPSGLNAQYQLPALAAAFGELRVAAETTLEHPGG